MIKTNHWITKQDWPHIIIPLFQIESTYLKMKKTVIIKELHCIVSNIEEPAE